ncbi:MAG: methyltransferase domain-containing protein, partial [Acidobacteria bacterium]|nr:methyltransferase domain-containing protein [Acidobacteriota bacterium]
MQQQPVRANKRLGQHFLKHPSLARKIVAGLGVEEGDTVLEIGCGTGALTGSLVGQGCRYVGVEVDALLCSQLRQRFSGPGIEFLNRDILTLDLGELRSRRSARGFRVVGNLP